MATELILVRHGQALRGSGNYLRAPLTPLGREQATRTGRFLRDHHARLDGLYCSPLRRARETAALIGDQIAQAPRVINGLEEMRFRELPLLFLLESLLRIRLFEGYLDPYVGRPIRWPLIGRVSTGLTALISHHPDQSILVVTHGGVISGTLCWYMPRERRRWWREVSNCSLTRLRVEGTKADLVMFNDTAHLNGQASPPETINTLELGEVSTAAGAPAPD